MKHNFNYKNDGPLNRYFADGANDDVINNPKSLYVLQVHVQKLHMREAMQFYLMIVALHQVKLKRVHIISLTY